MCWVVCNTGSCSQYLLLTYLFYYLITYLYLAYIVLTAYTLFTLLIYYLLTLLIHLSFIPYGLYHLLLLSILSAQNVIMVYEKRDESDFSSLFSCQLQFAYPTPANCDSRH